MNLIKRFALFYFLLSSGLCSSQQVIDRVIASVGPNIILSSEIEAQYNQYLGMGFKTGQQTRCTILEDLMYQRMLLAQAAHDSLKVTESQVDQEIERKLKYYIGQFGSVEKFESYNGKSVEAFKADIREKQKITGELTVSPKEVYTYFNSLAADSVPLVNAEIEIGQIVKKPGVNQELKDYARQKIEETRKKVIAGSMSFCAAAASISDDPGSRLKCGEYFGIQHGQFVPEFEAVAFKLKPNEISEVFETEYGFHFVQMIERRGDEIDLRHILVAIQGAPSDLLKSKAQLDSIRKILVRDTLKFCDAAAKYSDDKDTKNACGLLVNPQTGTTLFDMELLGQIDPAIVFTLDQMKPGDISEPVLMQTRDTKQAYRILYLKRRTLPHRANLKEDFPRIQEAALAIKQQKVIKDWVNKKLATTYVSITDDYMSCHFENGWGKAASKK
jgi:peptidyl-prolyl cis-trans isomerase SurA